MIVSVVILLAGMLGDHLVRRGMNELTARKGLISVGLAIGLMIVISKLTRRDVPPDIRMKMLVLHAPEALGLKQEYIREHEAGH